MTVRILSVYVFVALLVAGCGGKATPQASTVEPADEVLTIDVAVRGYSAGSAKMIGKFDELGSITVGKKADLVVLSDSLYEIDVEDIPNTTVLLTMMDGKITYAEPYAAASEALDDPKIKYSWQE